MIKKGAAERDANQLQQTWKFLIDKDMNKHDLKVAAGVSSALIAKLGKCKNVTTDVLLKITKALNVYIDDIMETIDD